jgi:hypothetical protein
MEQDEQTRSDEEIKRQTDAEDSELTDIELDSVAGGIPPGPPC